VTHWDEWNKTFRSEQGEWKLRVGADAQTMVAEAKFAVDSDLEWTGI
jgi:beta-glucosidase